MLNQVIDLNGKNGKVFNTTVKILDINTNYTEHGCNYRYLIKLQNGKNWGTFTFDDSIYHCMQGIQELNLMDIFYCLVSDWWTVENVGTDLDDIQQELIDSFGYDDIKAIKRISKGLLKNYELMNRVFTKEQIIKMDDMVRDY